MISPHPTLLGADARCSSGTYSPASAGRITNDQDHNLRCHIDPTVLYCAYESRGIANARAENAGHGNLDRANTTERKGGAPPARPPGAPGEIELPVV